MRCLSSLLLPAAILSATARLAGADPTIGAWNDVLVEYTKAQKVDSNTATRLAAILHSAQHQAVQEAVARAGPDDQAAQVQAAAAAGRTALLALIPSANASVNALYDQQMQGGAPRSQPLQDRAAELATTLVEYRATDGANAVPPPFRGSEEAGKWRPTPPEFKPMLTPQWGNIRPWSMTRGDQFRIPPPPALDSEAFRRDYLEVQSVGNQTSAARTPAQTEIGTFWAPSVELFWYQALKQATANLSLPDTARAYAATATAMADARIAAFNNKNLYQLWRPTSAIPQGNGVGLPADPTFQSLIPTPNHPEYPEGHATTAAAAATVLQGINGGKDAFDFTLTSDKAPGKTRAYGSFSDAAKETMESRTLSGVHFRFSGEASLPLGEKVGQAALNMFGYGDGPAPAPPAAGGKRLRRQLGRVDVDWM